MTAAQLATDPDEEEARAFPGARAPHRRRDVVSAGLRLAVHEWGDADGRPLLLAHGGFDFSRTYDVFAPLLADAGWRVVGWDQRGHGESEHAALYNWDADVRDAIAVLDTFAQEPVPVIGHSKGGGLMLALADACPQRVSALVNLDGMPSRRPQPDVADRERARQFADELESRLDLRRRPVGSRKPGTIDELAERRARMNPRLSKEWLRYLVVAGARHDADGWRWRIDPYLRMGGFGPWRPEWSLERLAGVGVPFLGFLGMIAEPMGWGTVAADVEPYLPYGAQFVPLADTGHFVHIERPQEVARAVLEFLDVRG